MKKLPVTFWLPAVMALLAAACGHAPLQSAGSGPAAELLAQADTLQQQGDLRSAIARAERAVRLEPRNAYAWHRLAALYFAQGDFNKAEQFARRSHQYAAGNREIIDANQRLLDEVSARRKSPGG